MAYRLAVYEKDSDDTDAIEIIHAETSGDAWAEFYARFGSENYTAKVISK